MITSARRTGGLFALLSLTIVTAAVIALRSAASAGNRELLAWGFTFDLTLTIPLLEKFEQSLRTISV